MQHYPGASLSKSLLIYLFLNTLISQTIWNIDNAVVYNLCVFADLFFLVQWIEEHDTVYDVIQAKIIVPPDDLDILDVKPARSIVPDFLWRSFLQSD